MSRLSEINRGLKGFDDELYAESKEPPRIDVYRRGSMTGHPHYIFSLTHNWGLRGRPVEWGILPIIERLKAIDLWNQGSTWVDQIVQEQEAAQASKDRDRKNNLESFLYEMRPQFAKATNDINTSLMNKRAGRFYKDNQ